MTRLKNILNFVNVANGAQATLAHGLNVGDLDVKPDEVKRSNGDFSIVSVTATSVTVQNDGSAPANCDVLVEHWHTIERSFGADQTTVLNPQPFIPAAGSSSSGSGSPPGTSIEVVTATAAEGVLANGVGYIPLRQGQDDTLDLQFVAAMTGNVVLSLVYFVSAANNGDVELRVDHLIVADGGDPSAALTAGTPFTFTPGNDVLEHTVDDTQSSEMVFAVTAGDFVLLHVQRPSGGGDTNTGDMRILQAVVRAA